MRNHGLMTAVFVSLIVIAGCGGGDESPDEATGSGPIGCDVRQAFGFCYEFTGGTWTETTAQSACEATPDAVMLLEGCPEDDRVALCTSIPEDDPGREIVYVYYRGADLGEVRSSCAGEFKKLR